MSEGTKFHESIAASWAQGYSNGSFNRRRSSFLPILDRSVKLGAAWLDLGCGSGVLTAELLRRGATVLAVDGSPSMLKEAQDLVIGGRSTLAWLHCDVHSLPQIANASLDGVLCSSVIEYVERPHAVVREAARVLRPGGKLIVSVPPKLSIVRMVQKAIRISTRIFGRDVFPYLSVSKFEVEPTTLTRWFRDAGFEIESIGSFDPILSGVVLKLLRPALLIVEANKK